MVNLLVQAVISGILLGTIYGLIGAGLNILYGVMRVVNFAHGEFLMVAAYATYWAGILYGIDPLKVLSILIPLFFILGLLTYYITVPRLLKSEDPEMASFLTFYGVSLIITALVLITWGADPRALSFPYGRVSINVGLFYLPKGRLITFGVALITAIALAFFLYRTYPGKAIRAVIQNREAVQIVGIDSHRISAISFGLGLALVAVTGALVPLAFPSISPWMGSSYTLVAFVVIVLGGLGNPLGALLGGLVFGLAENISTVFIPLAFSPVVSFVILILVIMVRPQGFLGRA